jgi:hypothetical protein
MKLLRTLALALLIAFAGAGAAHALTIGEWRVTQDHDNCSAMAPFEDGTMAYLGYFPELDRLSVVILDDKVFADVVDGAPIDAELTFVDNPVDKRVDSRWASLPVKGAILESGLHGVMLDGPTEPLLDTFARSQYFALVRNGKVLVSLHLERGPELVAALRACMAKL